MVADVTDYSHNRQHGRSEATPFSTLHEAVNFCYRNIPGRQKYPNFFELERGTRPYLADFDPNHVERIWARVLRGMQRVLLTHRRDARRAWMLCNLGDRAEVYSKSGNPHEEKRMKEYAIRRGERIRMHPDDAAKYLDVSKRTIFRWLEKINADLESEFQRRRLIPRPDDGRREGKREEETR
jgi:hypothetical protein